MPEKGKTKMLYSTAFEHKTALLDHFYAHLASRTATCLVLALLVPGAVWGAVLKANVYEDGTEQKPLLYKYEREEDPSTLRARFLTPEGTLYAEEELEKQGLSPTRYRIRIPLREQDGSAQLEAGTLTMSYSAGGKTKKDTYRTKDPVVIGPLLVDTILGHWIELSEKKPYSFRLLVLDRLETFGFKFVREEDSTWKGRPVARFLLKPTSFFVALAVRPIEFMFDPTTRKPLRIVGRTFLQKKDASEWKDFISETLFE